MSLTQAEAQAATQTNKTALNTAQDALFISYADAAIASAIAFSRYETTVTTQEGVNIQTVYQYYANLGYKVYFPDVPSNLDDNPAYLFGYFLDDYYDNIIQSRLFKNPIRITLNWY